MSSRDGGEVRRDHSADGEGWSWAALAACALDLVVPQACAGCGHPGSPWCAACRGACLSGSLHVPGPVPCRAATVHAGPAGRAVVAFKDGGVRRLARPLSELLAMAVVDVLAAPHAMSGSGITLQPPPLPHPPLPRRPQLHRPLQPPGPVWLVPVPSRRAARRRRGADPVGVLAGRAARLLRGAGLPVNRCAALTHVRDSLDQVGLSGQRRRANVAHTLRGRPVPPGLVVIVDDVTTTGSTLAEAARALAAAAPERCGPGLVLAATVTWSARAAPRVAPSRPLAL